MSKPLPGSPDRARELADRLPAMDPDEVQALIRSLSTEDLRALRDALQERQPPC